MILTGSKHVAVDLAWLRSRRLDDTVVRAATRGMPALGICGGPMMLGQRIDDPSGIEGFDLLADGPLTVTSTPRCCGTPLGHDPRTSRRSLAGDEVRFAP